MARLNLEEGQFHRDRTLHSERYYLYGQQQRQQQQQLHLVMTSCFVIVKYTLFDPRVVCVENVDFNKLFLNLSHFIRLTFRPV